MAATSCGSLWRSARVTAQTLPSPLVGLHPVAVGGVAARGVCREGLVAIGLLGIRHLALALALGHLLGIGELLVAIAGIVAFGRVGVAVLAHEPALTRCRTGPCPTSTSLPQTPTRTT